MSKFLGILCGLTTVGIFLFIFGSFVSASVYFVDWPAWLRFVIAIAGSSVLGIAVQTALEE